MKKYYNYIILVIVLMVIWKNIPIYANAEENPRVVRIGYCDYASFIEKDKDDNFTGYGVEYLQKIAEHTGWQYEYVYDTWENCLKMLENKEIDFVGTAQKTVEREKKFDFATRPNGMEQLVIYTRIGNDELYYNDYVNYTGKRVALLEGSYQTDLFRDYAKQHNFECFRVPMQSDQEMTQALFIGNVDMLVTGSLAMHKDMKVIGRDGAEPFYFMTYKGNGELLGQLNQAMNEIYSEQPYFSEELSQKYYGDSVVTTQPLFTRTEGKFVQNSQEIKVGYLSDAYPLTYYDQESHEENGILVGIMKEIAAKSGLKMQFISIEDASESRKLLEDKTIDLLIPDAQFRSGSQNYLMSNSLLETVFVPVGRTKDQIDLSKRIRIAFISDIPGEEKILAKYIDKYIPVYYDSMKECLEAVKKGDVDVFFENYYTLSYIMDSPYFETLRYYDGYSYPMECGAAAREDSEVLMHVLNKTINTINKDKLSEIVESHTMNCKYKLSLAEIMYKNRMANTIGTISVLVFLILFTIFLSTQKRYVREMEKKNQELVAANKARENFLSHMSHEIRTPLNGIKGSLDILKEKEKSKERKAIVEMASISANHLLNLVNDILDMSKIENGKFELHNSYLDAKEFVSYIDAIILPIAREKNIRIEKKIPPCAFEYILVDGNRLKQICINVLSNSVKFTSNGGKIIFSIHSEIVKENEVRVTISIEDNGKGMSKEFLEKALEPFTQENTSDTRTGSGLGLSITKQLVQLMGGTFSMESELGVGTKTTFEFVTKGLDHKPSEKEIDIEEGRIDVNSSKDFYIPEKEDLVGKHVLMVEDNEINMEIASMQLESFGLLVDKAVNGKEALENFEQSTIGWYDIILMDIMMPVMDGLEATKRIRKLPRKDASEVVIVAMTANAFADDIHKSFESGMNYHLSKPFDKAEMEKVLLDSIRRKKD